LSRFRLTFEQDGALARLALDNTGRRNAISMDMWRELPGLLQQANTANTLLLIGEGGHFSAGADIHEMGKLQGKPTAASSFRETMQKALAALRDYPHPSIAHIQGHCFGAGVALAMACDLRFAESHAKFSIPPAKLGLLYPESDIAHLVSLVGPALAKQWLFSGEVFSAANAARHGLINAEQSMAETLGLITAINANSPTSIASLKQLVDGRLLDPDAAFDRCFGENDFAEGLAAFAQKRRPRYS
jgi:enoyl-CoA hydratase/carnithine racemase